MGGHEKTAKIVHITFQLGAFSTLIAGILAIEKARHGKPQLISLHSWIGVATFSLYIANAGIGTTINLINNTHTTTIMTIHTHTYSYHKRDDKACPVYIKALSDLGGLYHVYTRLYRYYYCAYDWYDTALIYISTD